VKPPAAPGSAAERGGKPAEPPPRTLITDDALALFNLPGAGPAEFAVPAGLAVPAGGGPVAEAGEPAAAETVAPLDRHGQARVWVIDGRPRYHLAECRHLDGSAEPVSLNQAVQDGFTPCADCDPDNRITS